MSRYTLLSLHFDAATTAPGDAAASKQGRSAYRPVGQLVEDYTGGAAGAARTADAGAAAESTADAAAEGGAESKAGAYVGTAESIAGRGGNGGGYDRVADVSAEEGAEAAQAALEAAQSEGYNRPLDLDRPEIARGVSGEHLKRLQQGPRKEPDVEKVNWQDEFERTLMLPVATAQQRLDRVVAVRKLAQRFSRAARTLAQVIIEDFVLPVEARTYRPLAGKGVLGGEKYLAHGIFFKLTRDVHGIYGGDMGASKAAKHELKSLEALVAAQEEGLFFPLMCLVDYLGFRMVCTSFVPGLSEQSLRYGTGDAGRTVRAQDPELVEKIYRVCVRRLGLAPHNVIDKLGVVRALFGPADLEGHRIARKREDGSVAELLYLLDFSRLFPPESPRGERGGELCGEVIPCDEAEPVKDFSVPASDTREFVLKEFVGEEPEEQWSAKPDPATDAAKERQQSVGSTAAGGPSSGAYDPPAAESESGAKSGAYDTSSSQTELEARRAKWRQARAEFEGLRNLARSEGILSFNPRSQDPVNPRATAIAGVEIRGKALLWIDTGSIFFRLLRPELVRLNRRLLSSDAFSGFSSCARCLQSQMTIKQMRKLPTVPETPPACAHDSAALNLEVQRATEFMFGNPLEALSENMNNFTVAPINATALVRAMHDYGINARHMGRLRAKVYVPHLRRLMLSEMVARALRHMFTRRLREAHIRGQSVAAEAVSLFNLAFGLHAKSEAFWEGELKRRLVKKFGDLTRHGDEVDSLLQGVVKFPLFLRMQETIGVVFRVARVQSLFQSPAEFDQPTPFAISDVERVEPIVKSLNFDEEINHQIYALAVGDADHDASEERRRFEESKKLDERPPSVRDIIERIERSRTAASASGSASGGCSGGGGGGGGGAAVAPVQRAARDLGGRIYETYFTQAQRIFGDTHANVIEASIKLALNRRRSGKLDSALALSEAALRNARLAFGEFSSEYIQASVALGELHFAAANYGESRRLLEQALLPVEKTMGKHPLIAKLFSYLGRMMVLTGNKSEGASMLHEATKLYTMFYGDAVASALSPLVLTGTAEEVATSLGNLAHELKPMAQLALNEWEQLVAGNDDFVHRPRELIAHKSHVLTTYESILRNICLIEDVEGLQRGFYNHRSLELQSEQVLMRRLEHRYEQPKLADLQPPTAGNRTLVIEKPYHAGELATIIVRSAAANAAPPVSAVILPAAKGAQTLTGVVGARGNGEFAVYFVPVVAKPHAVTIEWADGAPAAQLEVQVSNGRPEAITSYLANLDELRTAKAEQDHVLRIRALDARGNPALSYRGRPTFVSASLLCYPFHLRDVPAPLNTQTGLFEAPFRVPMQGLFRVSVFVDGEALRGVSGRRADDYNVEISADPGKGRCNRVLAFGAPTFSLRICQRCAIKRPRTCPSCLAVVVIEGAEAALCQQCGLRNLQKLSSRCYLCDTSVPMNVGSASLRLCAKCGMNADMRRCIGKI